MGLLARAMDGVGAGFLAALIGFGLRHNGAPAWLADVVALAGGLVYLGWTARLRRLAAHSEPLDFWEDDDLDV